MKLQKKIILLLVFLFSVSFVSAVTIIPDNYVLSQEIVFIDDDFPARFLSENTTHYNYVMDYSKDVLLQTKVATSYSKGIPVWNPSKSISSSKNIFVNKTFEIAPGPIEEIIKDIGELINNESEKQYEVREVNETVYFEEIKKVYETVKDYTIISIPKEVGLWHIGNESTIIQVSNQSLGLTNNTRNNYAIHLTPFNNNLLRYVNFDIDKNNSLPVTDLAYAKNPNGTIFTNGNSILNDDKCFKNNCWSQTGEDGNQGTLTFNNFASHPDLNLSKYSSYSIFFRLRLNSNATTQNFVSNINYLNIQFISGNLYCTLDNSATKRGVLVGLNVNQSYLIGCVVNSTQISVYRNLDNGTDNSFSALTGWASQSLVFGVENTANYLNGTMDDIMIFNRSLTTSEISDLYNNITGFYTSNGSFITAVQNFSSVAQIEGDKLNITVNTSIPTGTQINLSNRFYNMTNISGLVLWAGIDDINNNTGFSVWSPYLISPLTKGAGTRYDIIKNSSICNDDLCFANLGSTSSTNYVRTNGSLNNSNFSMGFWFYIPVDVTSNNNIRFDTGNDSNIDYTQIGMSSSNKIIFSYNGTSYNNFGSFIINRTQFLFLTANQLNSTHTNLTFYQNGTWIWNTTSLIDTRNITRVHFAANGNGNANYSAYHDNFMYFNRPLTATEVTQLYTDMSTPKWSNYSTPCDVSANPYGCMFNRTTNFTQVKFDLLTTNTSLMPFIYDYKYTLQNIYPFIYDNTSNESINFIFNLSESYTPPNSSESIDLIFDDGTTSNVTPENNTCTYSSGNWNINCGDYCNISSVVNVGNNNILINGTGIIKLTADVFSQGKISIRGVDSSNKCTVRCLGGCFKSFDNSNTSLNNALCYQESANTSNQTGLDGNCNINYNGSYKFEGTINSNYSVNDGDLITFAEITPSYGNITINYTIPLNFQNPSYWAVLSSNVSLTNYTIPTVCTMNSTLQLKFNKYDGGTFVGHSGDCLNSSNNWIRIFNTNNGTGALNRIYEEAVWWNITG